MTRRGKSPFRRLNRFKRVKPSPLRKQKRVRHRPIAILSLYYKDRNPPDRPLPILKQRTNRARIQLPSPVEPTRTRKSPLRTKTVMKSAKANPIRMVTSPSKPSRNKIRVRKLPLRRRTARRRRQRLRKKIRVNRKLPPSINRRKATMSSPVWVNLALKSS